MKDISVEQLAEIVGTPPDKILLQMKEAGLTQSSSSDLVTDKDKKVLLEFLKSQQTKSSKTIKLKKKSTNEDSAKTTTIAIKRKKIKAEEKEENVEQESKRIDFNEIEKRRIEGEEFKKSEEADAQAVIPMGIVPIIRIGTIKTSRRWHRLGFHIHGKPL